MNNQTNFVSTAFVSCSLRNEDKPFVDFVERILIAHKIKPIGTVGRYSASPTNTADLMKKNIPEADFIVIVATPRYIQKDIKTGQVSYGVSEMVHVETGMAYMADKPVIVFVQEGTHIGNFLPNVTQYIVLNRRQDDLNGKWVLINSLILNTYNIVRQIKDKVASKSFWGAVTAGLAIFGGFVIADKLTSDDRAKPRRTSTRRKR